MGGDIFVRDAVLDSQLSQAELAEILRRVAAIGDSSDVNEQLRAEGVDSLHFASAPGGWYRITSTDLAVRAYRGPSVAVEARLRISSGFMASHRARVELKVVIATGTWLRLLTWPALLVGLVLWRNGYQAISSSPSSFLVFFLVICVPIGVYLLRARVLMQRMWPGLLAEARRFADGAVQLPAA